jgi:hypothetical protein
MRNTTMRDKLEELLVAPNDPQLEHRTAGLIASATKKRISPIKKKPAASPFSRGKTTMHEIAAELSKETARSPRYVTPPKKQNPFKVHVYPASSEPEPVVEEEKPQPVVEAKQAASKEEKIQTPAAHETPLGVAPWSPFTASVAIEKPELAPPVVVEPVIVEAAEPLEKTPHEVDHLHGVFFPESLPTLAETPNVFQKSVQPLAPVLSEAAEQEISEEQEGAQPVILLPANLQWLEKPTPFGDHLRPMVDRLRGAKTDVVFVLEQSTARQADLRNQIAALKEKLDREEYLGEQQREYLHQLDEVMAACALVAEQSVGVESILHAPVVKKHVHVDETGKKRKYKVWQADDPSLCHRSDIEKVFASDPGRKWDRNEILDALPAAKRAHGKVYTYAVLSTLTKEGIIRRLASGIYCAANG